MTHEERFEKAYTALRAAVPETEDCVILLVVASRNGEHSVASNLTDEGKIQLMKHVIDHMECKAPKKNLQ